ncbi:nitroreductase family protein [uncultured Muribaculum sp.]|uniref:nitroreductase family protein n=1 Tax=uncultured Muribaculum sp. TaxID=1918613 RepID=UPI0025FB3704|nr:nitroreductase family protein [uncultured Muribaculum sp.]
MDLDNIDKYFASRATVRSYTEREVEPSLLTRLIELASHAPTTGNMQLYSVVVTRSRADREALAPAHFGQPQVTSGAGVVLTFCVDINRFHHWCRINGTEAGFDNSQALMYGVLDCALFAQQFNTLAEMHGLGCCYLGTTLFTAPQIAETLHLPARVIPLVTLTVGYPAAPAEVSDRLPVEGIVHEGAYADYTDAAIRNLYASKEGRSDSAAFIKENNKETLAQVYAEVRYPRGMNEQFSKVLDDFLDSTLFNAGDTL